MAPLATPSTPIVDEAFMRLQVFAGPPREGDDRRYLLGEDIDALQARAASGDLDAMSELGSRLHQCLEAFNDPEGKHITDVFARTAEGRDAEAIAQGNELAFINYTSRMAAHRDCIALGRERTALGLGWLERAARAGHVAAKVAFATRAFDKAAYPDDKAMLSDLDEVLRRRELVDAWVRDGIESGERSALADIANSPDTTVRDPRMRAIYDLAWKMILARDFPEQQWAEQVSQLQGAEYRRLLRQAWTDEPGAWDAYIAEARRIASRTSELR